MSVQEKLWSSAALGAFDSVCDVFRLMVHEFIETGERLPNDENRIRDRLLEYILSNGRRLGAIEGFIINAEAQDPNVSGSSRGYPDLKLQPVHEKFNDQLRYYFSIECKRIDGTPALNGLYVDQGILRYCDGTYSSPTGLNGMLAFVVASCSEEDVRGGVNGRLILRARGHEQVQRNTVLIDRWDWDSLHSKSAGGTVRLSHRLATCAAVVV
ncbi:MAG: hypothetical protein JNM62_07070 [Flavobacteriales bacterium]|nr:hypothetical protein [Flavobacteriales bacterium]